MSGCAMSVVMFRWKLRVNFHMFTSTQGTSTLLSSNSPGAERFAHCTGWYRGKDHQPTRGRIIPWWHWAGRSSILLPPCNDITDEQDGSRASTQPSPGQDQMTSAQLNCLIFGFVVLIIVFAGALLKLALTGHTRL